MLGCQEFSRIDKKESKEGMITESRMVNSTKNFFSRIYNVLGYCCFLFRIVCDRKKDTVYVLGHSHMGDLLYILAYLRQFKSERNIKHITILAEERELPVCALFSPGIYDGSIIIRHGLTDIILKHIKFTKWLMDYFCIKFVDVFPVTRDPWLLKNFNIDIHSLIKKKLGISDLCKPEFPIFKQDSSVIGIEGFIDGSIIISPYSYSVKSISENFWRNLVKRLGELGYVTYTNIGPGQKAIDGTKTLSCRMEDLPNYVMRAKCLIGLRSGIFDLVVSCNNKLVVIFSKKDDFWFANVKNWGCNCSVVEYKGEPDVEEVVRHVCSEQEFIKTE